MSSPWSLRERNSGRVVVEELELATTFWRRFVGLQFRKSLPANRGLLMVPCSSIHTHWMRFPIDVVFLDESGRVLECRQSIAPWRFVAPVRAARGVLELNANRCLLRVGTKLELTHSDEQAVSLPQSLAGWNVRQRSGQ